MSFAIKLETGLLGKFKLQDASGQEYVAVVFDTYQEAAKILNRFDVGPDARIVEVEIIRAK
ncbi:MAG: hypothetical protein ACRDCE_08200 [Cetobacterium sp.]|uniref:hypothetical protein n=1 Tax=Cetobacterium sp. TaxID=2071632 RepID=UPI003EE495CD